MHFCSKLLIFSFITTILTGFNDVLCNARDSINSETPLNKDETLVSAGNKFQLGFFTPEGNTNNAYVGIWYFDRNPRTIVWFHNNNPSDPSEFGIREERFEIWSGSDSNKTLQLLDSGNLVLWDRNVRSWESFNYPTDTFLPGMKMDENLKLTSWKSSSDPSLGDFTFMQQQGGSQVMVKNRSETYWKSGSFSKSFDLIPTFISQLFLNSNRSTGGVIMQNHSLNYTRPSFSVETGRLFMNSSGQIQYYGWNTTSNISYLMWFEPQDACSVYNYCGSFSICNTRKNPICRCLPGYSNTPDSQGCMRGSLCDPGKDTFSNHTLMKVERVLPYDSAHSSEACKEECSSNCKCNAYSYTADYVAQGGRSSGAKCFIWDELINLQDNDPLNGFIISLRVPQSKGLVAAESPQPVLRRFARSRNTFQNRYLISFIVSFLGVVLVFGSCFVFYQRRMIKRNGNQDGPGQTPVLFSNESETQLTDFMLEHEKVIDVPFYSFRDILSATENFSDANKLGQGGFGPVYKGIFPGGQEFAVKRLSSCSGQGIEEFRNEVILIAKLQHRNLVRLLGYSVTENEKILLYEYMSNRSLDAFIFDKRNNLLLDWKKRFDIILEIARGLLYLHQDSRLRIIHRDLKTSNILLDGEMNAKISDFGLARIVEGKGTEASTNKIVGTYGYMSPEYAMDGKFSFKSDVFSFGVVVLEIISGKRNTGVSQSQEASNLLGYAWGLWSENKALDLVDLALNLSCDEPQVIKCINLALLCVQEDPNDRPTMSTVIAMLSSETNVPQSPLQPAFIVRKRLSTISSSSTKLDTISENMLTITTAEGR